MEEIIVRNKRVISDYFHASLETGEDLLKRRETNIKEFIKEYQDILVNEDYSQFKDFTVKTGLSILRIYHIDNRYEEFYMDELGMHTKWENDEGIPVEKDGIFKNHLTIHIYLDKMIKEKKEIVGFINNQKQFIYKEKKKENTPKYDGRKIREVLDQENLSEEEKLRKLKTLLPKEFFSKLKMSSIKQMKCIPPFEDFLLLKKNGDLFVNGRLYATKVREICYLTFYRTYLIFENEEVEFYTCPFINSAFPTVQCIKTQAVNQSFLASLTKEKDVFISMVGNEDIEADFDIDTCMDFYLSNIDDFTYYYDLDNKVTTLKFLVDNREIQFPLYIRRRK